MAMFQYTSLGGNTEAIQPNEIVSLKQGGLPEKDEMIFSVNPFIAGNLFDATINGVAVEQVPFDTDNDTTVTNIATAIQALNVIVTATFVSGTQIDIVGPNGVALVFTGVVVTVGIVPTVVTTETQASISETTILLRNRDEIRSSTNLTTLIIRLDGLI